MDNDTRELLKISDYIKAIAENIADGADINDYYDLLLAKEMLVNSKSTKEVQELIKRLEQQIDVDHLKPVSMAHKYKIDSVKYEFIPYRCSVDRQGGAKFSSESLKEKQVYMKINGFILYIPWFILYIILTAMEGNAISNDIGSVICFLLIMGQVLYLIFLIVRGFISYLALENESIAKQALEWKLLPAEWYNEVTNKHDRYASADDKYRIESCKIYRRNLESYYQFRMKKAENIYDYVHSEMIYRERFQNDKNFRDFCLGK